MEVMEASLIGALNGRTVCGEDFPVVLGTGGCGRSVRCVTAICVVNPGRGSVAADRFRPWFSPEGSGRG